MPIIFDGDTSGCIQTTGQTEQTIQGDLTLSANNGAVSMSFENSESSTSIGINTNGDLALSSEDGSVVVETPNGENTNAVVNVAYVNNVVGTIETVLETV